MLALGLRAPVERVLVKIIGDYKGDAVMRKVAVGLC